MTKTRSLAARLINGGKLLDKKDCGMPVGTVIEVAHLFNSVPARRKFLKTDPTETAHITYNTRLFAVAHPNIAFRVLENGRTVFQSPACDNLRDRIAEIWGRSLADDLIPVDVTDAATGYRLTGLTAKPGVGRATRRELVTLVNRRPIDSRTLGFAVLDAYHGRIQKGRYPPAFLFLEIHPHEVDVNVHPAKREVRFRDDSAIRRFVLSAITETLAASREDVIAQPDTPTEPPQAAAPELEPKPTPSIFPPAPAIAPVRIEPIQPQPEVVPNNTAQSTAPKPIPSATPKPSPAAPAHSEAAASTTPTWRFITLLKKRYALFDTPRGLVMLHLRHADQRVRFERISRQFNDETPTSQRLLIPQPLEFEPLASEALKAQLKRLNAQGFEVAEFGRNFYRIEAVPTWLSPEQAEAFIRDLVDLARQRGGMRKESPLSSEAVARLAVKGSYRRSDSLTAPAVEQLAKDLLACETPHTSPFGKPTFSEVSWSEWTRRFGGD